MFPRDMLLASLINYVHFTKYIGYYLFISVLFCSILLDFSHLQ